MGSMANARSSIRTGRRKSPGELWKCLGRPAKTAGGSPAASYFSCFAKKSNQKKATPGIRLIPPVLATRGTRTNRPMARKSARGGLMVRVYDRALLRSSGRIHGDPVELILDRFAINQIESGRLATITGWKSTPSIRFVSTKPASASIDLSLSIEIA